MQQESVDEAERNVYLVNYVDYAFDDFGGRQTPVYPGLSTVWGSLARSKVSVPFISFISLKYIKFNKGFHGEYYVVGQRLQGGTSV